MPSSLKPRPRADSEKLTSSACDALRRAIDRRHRFALAVVAFIMLGPGALFYIADLVRTEAATLWAMLYFGAVCWAFSHERELQRQIDDIRAGRDPRRQHESLTQ